MSDHADKLRDILELTEAALTKIADGTILSTRFREIAAAALAKDCSRGQWEPLLDALVAERDEWEVAAKKISGARNRWKKRAEAAEAQVQQLKAALLTIAELPNTADHHFDDLGMSEIARDALADVPDKETP